MKAIVDYTAEDHAKMSAAWSELQSKVKGTYTKDWFDDFRKTSGYAHYKFSGTITDKLIELLGHEPSSDEIIMLVDSGFSHFGASCSISGRRFSGSVNID